MTPLWFWERDKSSDDAVVGYHLNLDWYLRKNSPVLKNMLLEPAPPKWLTDEAYWYLG